MRQSQCNQATPVPVLMTTSSSSPSAQQQHDGSTTSPEPFPVSEDASLSPAMQQYQQHSTPFSEPFPAFDASIIPRQRAAPAQATRSPEQFSGPSMTTVVGTPAFSMLYGTRRLRSATVRGRGQGRDRGQSSGSRGSSLPSSSSSSTIKPGQRTPRQADFLQPALPPVSPTALPDLATLFAELNDLLPDSSAPVSAPAPSARPVPARPAVPAILASQGAQAVSHSPLRRNITSRNLRDHFRGHVHDHHDDRNQDQDQTLPSQSPTVTAASHQRPSMQQHMNSRLTAENLARLTAAQTRANQQRLYSARPMYDDDDDSVAAVLWRHSGGGGRC